MTYQPTVYIVDDDEAVCNHLALVIENAGLHCKTFSSAEQFLENYSSVNAGCLILDVYLPGLDGHQLQSELKHRNIRLPILFITAYGDIPMAVQAMKAGSADFFTKPVPINELLERIHEVLENQAQEADKMSKEQHFHHLIGSLTYREMEVLPLAIAGIHNKEIAKRLGISHRTVERHRIKILKKTDTYSFLELAALCEANNYRITGTSK